LVRALQLAGAPDAVAEDVAQEAFARLLTHWRRVRSGSSPAGYAYRTAFRLLNRRRADGGSGARPQAAGTPPPREAADSGDTANLVATRLAVAGALAAMPPRQRACAVMCLVLGLSTRDAAASLGIAEGTVRKHLAEARHDLRDVLADRAPR
jgi:RNA polymerase sigma-70 factor (ECF subfamily)